MLDENRQVAQEALPNIGFRVVNQHHEYRNELFGILDQLSDLVEGMRKRNPDPSSCVLK